MTRSAPTARRWTLLPASLLLAACHLVAPYDPPGVDGPAVGDAALLDGRPDTSPDGDLGAGLLGLSALCQKSSQCESGYCVDGVCCNTPCLGTCVACDITGKVGTCRPFDKGKDPDGECKGDASCGGHTCGGKDACAPFEPVDTSCGKSTCSGGDVTQWRCDSKGGCVKKTTSCWGYACSGGVCATKCDATSLPCQKGFWCDGGVCAGNLPKGSLCGTNDKACQSGHCVDQVCCNSSCTTHCMACNNSASPGTCSWVPTGKDPRDVCKGTKDCGHDTCDGMGKCTVADTNKECKRQCSGSALFVYSCGNTGQCDKKKTSTCTPYRCVTVGSKQQCAASCTSSTSHCVNTSACDRSNAHTTGEGVCLSPAKVVVVTKPGTLASGLKTVANSKTHTHVRLNAGTYSEINLNPAGEVTVIGAGAVTVSTPSAGQPVIRVTSGIVTLQGLTISGSKGKDGVECKGNEYGAHSGWPTLHVLESTIEQNDALGIKAESCHLKLRRNVIRNNKAGAIKVEKGAITIVNNLIVKNGSASASENITLDQGITSLAAAFVHNTVADNTAALSGDKQAGIKCKMGVTIYNSVVTNNTKAVSGQPDLCVYKNCALYPGWVGLPGSNIYSNPLLDKDYKLTTTSPCIDAGDNAQQKSVLDLAGGDRKKGSKVDIGAYELK